MSDSGWKKVSAIMDSGSAECVAPETIASHTQSTHTHEVPQVQFFNKVMDAPASTQRQI